jgi:predicted transcriptional regulator
MAMPKVKLDQGRGEQRPTPAELAILRVLWALQPCTVREVHEQLNPDGGNSYTTTLKMMQIMTEKGLVSRDTGQRAHIYRANCTEQHERRAFVDDLANRLFDGSAAQLALQALGQSGQVDADELAEIKALIERLEARRAAR